MQSQCQSHEISSTETASHCQTASSCDNCPIVLTQTKHWAAIVCRTSCYTNGGYKRPDEFEPLRRWSLVVVHLVTEPLRSQLTILVFLFLLAIDMSKRCCNVSSTLELLVVIDLKVCGNTITNTFLRVLLQLLCFHFHYAGNFILCYFVYPCTLILTSVDLILLFSFCFLSFIA